tara:strand:+ start:8786 stop:9904 length:1119 start_codon:yes stop_codon:yes gene_type:complete
MNDENNSNPNQFDDAERLLSSNRKSARDAAASAAASDLGSGTGDRYTQERTGASQLASDALNSTLKGIMSGMKLAKDQRMGARQRASEAGGLFNRSILEAVPVYNATSAEGARFADGGIKGHHNTFIVMGRDRPASESSGGGADPTTHCGCIDIIAGMSSVLARETVSAGPDAYQNEAVLTNKSPGLDAARIYITQKAKDIDSKEYFNLAAGKVGRLPNRSAIVLKADSMRVVGREGIKLVTGDIYNGGLGMNISHKVKGIDLIAGNNDADLQPLVKGQSLKFVIDSQLELTKDLHTSVSVLYNLIVYFLLSMVDPSGYSSNRLNDTIQELPQEFINLWIQEMNFLIHELNYNTEKNPFAAYNFMSRHNTTN